MSTPLVPPRPSRANGGGGGASKDAMPQVPPRPARKQDPSPIRSPLNDLPHPRGLPKQPPPSSLSTEVPARPPSVSLPSIGQEGSEYVTYEQLPAEARGASGSGDKDVGTPEHTSNVSETVPLHAPKASVSDATAKSRIATVTKTDSTQAAAAGIGQSRPADDVHLHPTTGGNDDLRRVHTVDSSTLKHDLSANRSTPSLHHGSRPASIHDGNHEHGIPQIGSQIPLYPNAGDVQAPSPGQISSPHAPGVGFFNDGSARAHQRRRSAKYEFGPPGSYGLHSHTHAPTDQFERDWYAKNPEKAALEGHYGRPAPISALSSAQLNRMVTQTDDSEGKLDPGAISTPGEEIGWTAAEEYVSRSRSGTPNATPLAERKKRASSGSQPATESLQRRTSYPFNAGRSDGAIDDGIIHVNAPERRASQIEGGGIADGGMDLGPHGGNTSEEGGFWEERGAGTPILASDEVLKRPGSAYMVPAVESHDYDDELGYHDSSRRGSLRVPSRPSSRPNSMHGDYHGGNLHRFMSHDEHHASGVHTPLEEIEEYEPLIPEDDPEPKPKPKMVKRLRPGLEHHHFPSQDTWEDTPTSLQYHTTVGTPDLPRESGLVGDAATMKTAETNEEDQKITKVQSHDDVLNQKKAPIKTHYAAEHLRPGVQRFPSKDIWEDTPDSMQYVTTVGSPQMDETRSPPDDRPTTTAIPESQDESDARATTAGGFKPVTPSRPHRRSKLAEEIRPDLPDQQRDEASKEKELPDVTEEKPASPEKAKAPAIPDRPKPTVPVRPARSSRSDKAAETTAEAPTVTKTKPAVPARPVGEKIASLKAGFMSDLNSRLKIGPPKAKEPEPEAVEETEKAPLEDARKSRAKGPARRKPAASPAAMADAKPMVFSISTMQTNWSIGEDGRVEVPDVSDAPLEKNVSTIEKAMTDNAEANTGAAAPASHMSEEKSTSGTMEPSTTTQAPSSSLDADLSPLHSTTSPPPAEDMDQKIDAAITTLSDESDKTKEEVTVDTEKPVAETTTANEAQAA